MQKFKIKDLVKVVRIREVDDENEEYTSYIGKEGKIIGIKPDSDSYRVYFHDVHGYKVFYSDELILIKEYKNNKVYPFVNWIRTYYK